MSVPVSHRRAIGYALSAFTLWALGDAMIKLAGEMTAPPYQILGFGTLAAAIIIAGATIARGKARDLVPRQLPLQLLLSVIEWGAYFCTIVALTNLPLTTFYIVVFMAPMTIGILAALILHEELTRGKLLATLAGFAGVLVAINPFGDDFFHHPLIGYLAVFGTLSLFSICMILLRVLGRKSTSESTAFTMHVFMAAASLSFCLWHFEPMTGKQWMFILGTGFTGGFAWLMMAQAYKHAPAATVAPFHYSQIIVGGILGYLIWRDVPTVNLIIGAFIIIGSGLYLAAQANKPGNIAG